MANGRSRTGRATSSQNPRGPQFSIRSGDRTFVGRAANVEYVRHVVSAGRQSLLRACGEAVGEMIATEVDPDIRKLTRRLDALELENKNLRARIVAIDAATSLRLSKSPTIANFKSRRPKGKK